MPDEEGLALLAVLFILGGGKKVPIGKGWYYEQIETATARAEIEFSGGLWECSFAGIQIIDDTAHGAYRSQLLLYKDSRANRAANFSELNEYFINSGYMAYGHQVQSRAPFMIRGPCTLIGQCVNKLGDTFSIRLYAKLKQLE